MKHTKLCIFYALLLISIATHGMEKKDTKVELKLEKERVKKLKKLQEKARKAEREAAKKYMQDLKEKQKQEKT